MKGLERVLLVGALVLCGAAPAWAFEVEVGSETRRTQHWQREDLITGRDLDYLEQETAQWGRIGFGLGRHHFSVRGEQTTLEGFNRVGDLLQSQTSQVVVPRWDYRVTNLQMSFWRVMETPVESGGSYAKAWEEPESYALDFWNVKTEKNREFLEFNSGMDVERELAESGRILRRHYQWYEFALGAYNKDLKGWRAYGRKRRQEYPEIDLASAVYLGGFEYYDKKPVEPRPEPYWKRLRIAVDRISIADQQGFEGRIESDFSFVAFESQQVFKVTFIGRNLKLTYDDSWTQPSRVESGTGQLLQQYEYLGQTQLWGTPFLLKWRYRFTDAPFLADYRQDVASLSLAFDY